MVTHPDHYCESRIFFQFVQYSNIYDIHMGKNIKSLLLSFFLPYAKTNSAGWQVSVFTWRSASNKSQGIVFFWKKKIYSYFPRLEKEPREIYKTLYWFWNCSHVLILLVTLAWKGITAHMIISSQNILVTILCPKVLVAEVILACFRTRYHILFDLISRDLVWTWYLF